MSALRSLVWACLLLSQVLVADASPTYGSRPQAALDRLRASLHQAVNYFYEYFSSFPGPAAVSVPALGSWENSEEAVRRAQEAETEASEPVGDDVVLKEVAPEFRMAAGQPAGNVVSDGSALGAAERPAELTTVAGEQLEIDEKVPNFRTGFEDEQPEEVKETEAEQQPVELKGTEAEQQPAELKETEAEQQSAELKETEAEQAEAHKEDDKEQPGELKGTEAEQAAELQENEAERAEGHKEDDEEQPANDNELLNKIILALLDSVTSNETVDASNDETPALAAQGPEPEPTNATTEPTAEALEPNRRSNEDEGDGSQWLPGTTDSVPLVQAAPVAEAGTQPAQDWAVTTEDHWASTGGAEVTAEPPASSQQWEQGESEPQFRLDTVLAQQSEEKAAPRPQLAVGDLVADAGENTVSRRMRLQQPIRITLAPSADATNCTTTVIVDRRNNDVLETSTERMAASSVRGQASEDASVAVTEGVRVAREGEFTGHKGVHEPKAGQQLNNATLVLLKEVQDGADNPMEALIIEQTVQGPGHEMSDFPGLNVPGFRKSNAGETDEEAVSDSDNESAAGDAQDASDSRPEPEETQDVSDNRLERPGEALNTSDNQSEAEEAQHTSDNRLERPGEALNTSDNRPEAENEPETTDSESESHQAKRLRERMLTSVERNLVKQLVSIIVEVNKARTVLASRQHEGS